MAVEEDPDKRSERMHGQYVAIHVPRKVMVERFIQDLVASMEEESVYLREEYGYGAVTATGHLQDSIVDICQKVADRAKDRLWDRLVVQDGKFDMAAVLTFKAKEEVRRGTQ